MRQRTRLIINVLSNYGAFAVYGAVNFFLAGYMARVFGKDLFGIAMLVTSFTIITEFLGRGICQALTKHIAADTEKTDVERFHGLVNTSFVWLLACSVAGALICVILSEYIDKISNMPPELVGQARIGMLLIALKVLVCFPLNTFQSILWSYQRYDLTNLARTIAIILRAVLVVIWFEFVAAGLMQLICITIFTTLLEEAIWIYCSYKITEELKFRLRYVSLKMFRLLFSFGGFIFIIVLSNLLGYEAIKWMVNLEMPVREVGAYSLIATLAMFAGNMVRSIANVLMPTASSLHARNMHDKNIILARLSTKYALVVAGLFCLVPLFLLEPFLTLWVGDTYSSDYLSKVAIAGIILLIGQYIMDSSACCTQMITGMGKVAFLSMTNLSGAVIGLTCVWIYLHWFDSSIIGVALIVTTARITGTFVKLTYGIKVIRIATKRFILDSLMKPTVVCLVICSAGYGLAKAINVYKISEFMIAVMILGILHVCGTWFIVFTAEERKGVIRRLADIRKSLQKKSRENLAVNT